MMVDWIIQTICKHIIAQQALAGGNEGVGVDEAAEFGVIISALEIIESRFVVVDIATVLPAYVRKQKILS